MYKEAMEYLIAPDDVDEVYNKYPKLNIIHEKNIDIHFKREDMYSDVDVQNIFKLIKEYGNINVLEEYFSYGYKKRFSMFVDNKDLVDISNEVLLYTWPRYGIHIWPLFKDYNDMPIEIPVSLSMAARNAYVQYLYGRIKNEK